MHPPHTHTHTHYLVYQQVIVMLKNIDKKKMKRWRMKYIFKKNVKPLSCSCSLWLEWWARDQSEIYQKIRSLSENALLYLIYFMSKGHKCLKCQKRQILKELLGISACMGVCANSLRNRFYTSVCCHLGLHSWFPIISQGNRMVIKPHTPPHPHM